MRRLKWQVFTGFITSWSGWLLFRWDDNSLTSWVVGGIFIAVMMISTTIFLIISIKPLNEEEKHYV